MERIELVLVSIIVLTCFSIGLITLVGYLLKKIKQLKQVHVKLKPDHKKLAKVIGHINTYTLEERLILIQSMLGNINVVLTLDGDEVIIQGVGKLPDVEHPNPTGPMDYTG